MSFSAHTQSIIVYSLTALCKGTPYYESCHVIMNTFKTWHSIYTWHKMFKQFEAVHRVVHSDLPLFVSGGTYDQSHQQEV